MRIVMMGTGTFAEPTFEALLAGSNTVVGLVTSPDRVMGQERGSTRQVGRGLKAIALERQLPVFQPESINTPEGVAGLNAWQPDLLVVAAYGQILSAEVLGTATRGGINIHASLLPKYRGAAPVAWAIYHGETCTGVSIIRMSVSLDAGDILAQKAVDILPGETAGELEGRLAPLGAELAFQVIDQLVTGTVQGIKQDKALVTRAPKLTKEHGLIDWTRTAAQVSNQVQAMQPWPTAYTFLYRQEKPPQRVLITRIVASPVRSSPSVPPGKLIPDPGSPDLLLLVAAGTMNLDERSVVEVQELQPAGKRRMTAGEFLRGYPVQPGDSFGPPPPS